MREESRGRISGGKTLLREAQKKECRAEADKCSKKVLKELGGRPGESEKKLPECTKAVVHLRCLGGLFVGLSHK